MLSAGYSGTPLVKKLGIKSTFKCLLINEPKNYFELLMSIPDKVEFYDDYESKPFDFVHLFVTDHDDLKEMVDSIRTLIVSNGMLWISWPKGSSKIPKSTNETFIRRIVLQTDMVDIKVCAVDKDWSGLKFVIRKESR
jgi:hypothetical protein